MRIYRHALESIFAMLELADLTRVLVVSRSWSAAVRSMKPIGTLIARDNYGSLMEMYAFRPLPPIASLVGSPILRHLAAIHIRLGSTSWSRLSNAALGLLAQHAPNLTSLWCALTFTETEQLILPAKLQSLKLQLWSRHTDTVINIVLLALVALPSLSRLCLNFLSFDLRSSVVVSLLAACPSLTDLRLRNRHEDPPVLTPSQVDQIRLSLGHLCRLDVGWMDSDKLARFLQSPVTARWQDIGSVKVDERTGELLLRLPSLTRLDLTYSDEFFDDDEDIEAATLVKFLPQLPLLTALNLDCSNGGASYIPADVQLAALVLCTHLTELSLEYGFNFAHWSALFAKLTIKKLRIRQESIDTLQCFAAGPITDSLEELTLDDLKLSPSELAHLYGLRRLRTLHLDRCFSSRLEDAVFDHLSPPTPLLPALAELRRTWHTGCMRDIRLRQRPSFEWMQARQTQ